MATWESRGGRDEDEMVSTESVEQHTQALPPPEPVRVVTSYQDRRDAERLVEAFLAAWAGAELSPDAIRPVTDVLARRDAIRQAARDMKSDNTLPRIVERLVAGQVDFRAATRELSDIELANDRPPGSVLRGDSRVTRLLNAAESPLLARALDSLTDPAIVAEARRGWDAITDEARKLKLRGVTEEVAREAGGKTWAAWRRFTELSPRRSYVGKVFDVMGQLGVLGDDVLPDGFGQSLYTEVVVVPDEAVPA